MGHSSNCSNPGASPTPRRVEPGCSAHWVGELRGAGTPAEGEEGGDAVAVADQFDPEHRLGARVAGITVVGEEPNLGGLTCPRRQGDGDLGDPGEPVPTQDRKLSTGRGRTKVAQNA